MGIYSGTQKGDGDDRRVEPDSEGRILCIPTWDGGEEVNTKFRSRDRHGNKLFWQIAGGRKTFYNIDVLDEAENDWPIVITEGEMDTLAALTAGVSYVISVPDGAPATRDQHGNLIPMKPDSEVDPDNDEKFKYILYNWDRLKPFKRFVLATDGDEPGQRLADELARRLGKVRCSTVRYPSDEVVPTRDKAGVAYKRACKDLNEVLVHFGREAVVEVIERAKPYPISGLYKMSDFQPVRRVLYEIGMRALHNYVNMYEGAFIVMSGLPGSGKSVVADQLAFNMAVRHNWAICHAHFEEDPKPDLQRKLRHMYIAKHRNDWTAEDKRDADSFIDDRYCFITRALNDDDEEITVEWLIEKLDDAVLRYGIKLAVIDPWNEMLHRKMRGEQRDEYINRALSMLKRWAKQRMVALIIVAHPTKEAAKTDSKGDKKGPMTLFDISDGAAWANKAEIGIIIYRLTHTDVNTEVHVRKVKFKGTGMIGQTLLTYDTMLEQFA